MEAIQRFDCSGRRCLEKANKKHSNRIWMPRLAISVGSSYSQLASTLLTLILVSDSLWLGDGCNFIPVGQVQWKKGVLSSGLKMVLKKVKLIWFVVFIADSVVLFWNYTMRIRNITDCAHIFGISRGVYVIYIFLRYYHCAKKYPQYCTVDEFEKLWVNFLIEKPTSLRLD